MYEYKLEDAICRRSLTVQGGSDVLICLWAPQRYSDVEYHCPYKIDGLEKPVQRFSRGIDGFQATILALEIIHAYLKNSQHAKDGKLEWLEDNVNFGFNLSFDKPYGV